MMETKHLNLASAEVKADGDSLKFSGYASVFGGIDSYNDTIVKGAYQKTLDSRDRPIALRWNHYGPIIGKCLTVTEDEKGLYVEGELTKGHSVAEDTAALLKHGAISGMSIGYMVKDHEIKDGVRHLKEIELIEISIVEEPADNNAHITSVKSAKKLKDVEEFLRLKGLSRAEATEIVASVKRIHGEREALKENDEVKTLLTGWKLK